MMNRQMIISVLIFVFSVFISSVSQIILKKSASRKYDSKIKEYLNIYVISAYSIFFCSSLITVYSYKNVPLSVGPAIEASGYLFIAVLGKIFLNEKISRRKFIGLVVIVTGICISCLNI